MPQASIATSKRQASQPVIPERETPMWGRVSTTPDSIQAIAIRTRANSRLIFLGCANTVNRQTAWRAKLSVLI